MKRAVSVVLALVFVLVFFAACAGGNTQSPSAPSGSTSTPPPAASGGGPSGGQPNNSGGGASSGNTLDSWDFSKDKTFNFAWANYLNDTNVVSYMLTDFRNYLYDITEGTIDITLYNSASLVPESEGADSVRDGMADFCNWPFSYSAGTMPIGNMVALPGVAWNNNQAATYAINEWYKTLNADEVKDYHLLGAYGVGNGVYMTTKAIRSVDDFVNTQIRCMGGQAAVMSAYQAIPVAMPIGEVYEALRTGVVQGCYVTIVTSYTNKLHEVVKFVTWDPYFLSALCFLMNQDSWNSLSEGQKAAMDDAAMYLVDLAAYVMDGQAVQAYDLCVEAGVEFITFSDEDYKKMSEMSAPVLTEYIADLDSKGYDASGAMAFIRELAEKYNAIY